MIYTRRYAIHEAASFINWLYFFHAWGFPSRYSSIATVHGCVACRQNWLQAFPVEERERAEQAMKLYDEAQQLLREWDEAGYYTVFSVRLMEANSDGEDVVLLETGQHIPFLRQQHAQDGKPCYCLADFIRPVSSGVTDKMGVFASTVPSQIPIKGLEESLVADRLAEATAELGHLQTRPFVARPEHLFRAFRFVGFSCFGNYTHGEWCHDTTCQHLRLFVLASGHMSFLCGENRRGSASGLCPS